MRLQFSNKGFTLIELLIVAAILGIIIAIAIPNLIKARISSNEANSRKVLQVLRDAEYQYYEQDLDEDNLRDFTAQINSDGQSLRFPVSGADPIEALVDDSFIGAVVSDGDQSTSSICVNPKSGYCITWTSDFGTSQQELFGDFGWETSPSNVRRTGRHDFSVFSDKAIRCTLTTQSTGQPGTFDSSRSDPDCDL